MDGLFLAGDWTDTGWPATMEGAVRSGYLAAQGILKDLDRPARLIRPGLPPGRLATWLLGLPSTSTPAEINIELCHRDSPSRPKPLPPFLVESPHGS